MLTSDQFDRTRRLALELAGIELCDRHRELFGHRSRRLGIRDATGIDALLTQAEAGNPGARRQLVGLITTHFTGFFRHPGHFSTAADHAREVVSRQGCARLWSAASATGQEPYSLAMALMETFQFGAPAVSILATDIDEDALLFARRGEYRDQALRSLGPERRARFFRKIPDDHRWSVSPAVRQLVEFRSLNLAAAAWPVTGPFDVIFCRNVLMYMQARVRYVVLEHLASLLAPAGVLVLDPTENLGRATHWFSGGRDGLYRRRSQEVDGWPSPALVRPLIREARL